MKGVRPNNAVSHPRVRRGVGARSILALVVVIVVTTSLSTGRCWRRRWRRRRSMVGVEVSAGRSLGSAPDCLSFSPSLSLTLSVSFTVGRERPTSSSSFVRRRRHGSASRLSPPARLQPFAPPSSFRFSVRTSSISFTARIRLDNENIVIEKSYSSDEL